MVEDALFSRIVDCRRPTRLIKQLSMVLNLPEGSWYAMYKIKNDKVWKEFIKTGKVRGISIQGFFSNYAEMMSRMIFVLFTKGKECACGKSEIWIM
jgi:hypothetical protein